MGTKITVVTAEIIDNKTMTLHEICQACGVHAEFIIELVEVGVLEPLDVKASRWKFECAMLKRAKSAVKLHQDLQINYSGLAVVLDLLEELEDLRERVKFLEHHFK